jgi:uncharacterized protein (TIGR00369 family)
MTRREQAAGAERAHGVSADPQIDQRIRASFARMETMATFGATLEAVRNGEVEIVLPFSTALVQQHGFIHAGVLATIADTACGYAALTLMPGDAAVLTTEFKIHLLSPAKGERFTAVGRVVRPGRKLTVCLGEVFADDGQARKQVALMTASMMVVDGATGLRD